MVENVQAVHKIEDFGEPHNKKDNGGFANISAADSYKHFVENQRNIGELETVIIEELADISEISGPNLNKNETQTVIIEELTDISEMSGPNSNSVSNVTTNELTTKSIEKLKESDEIKLFDNQGELEQNQKSEKNDKGALNKQCLPVHEEKKSIKNPVSNKSLSKIDEIGSWQNGVFTCSICGKEFLEKLKLVRHVESVHERNKADLAEHVESVSDIEPFGEKSDKC